MTLDHFSDAELHMLNNTHSKQIYQNSHTPQSCVLEADSGLMHSMAQISQAAEAAEYKIQQKIGEKSGILSMIDATDSSLGACNETALSSTYTSSPYTDIAEEQEADSSSTSTPTISEFTGMHFHIFVASKLLRNRKYSFQHNQLKNGM